MTTSRSLFVSSAVFSGTIAIAYWFIAKEPAGTTLLVFMTGALGVVALYMYFAERDAQLLGDDPKATMADAAGENVGTYVTHSPIPFWIGVATCALMVGMVVSPVVAGCGVLVIIFLGALLIVRSR